MTEKRTPPVLGGHSSLHPAAGEGAALSDDRVRHVEERLRRSVSLLQATLDATGDGILVVDRSGRIVSHNRRFREIWGIPEADLEGGEDDRAIAAVLDQLEDPDGFEEKIRDLYRDVERESSDTLDLKDGRVLERHSRPQRIGDEVIGRVWSFRDVTDRKRMEEALLTSESRYRRLFEESRHALYISTRQGDFVDVNRAMLELFGYSRSELLSLNAGALYADPTARDHFREQVGTRGSVRNHEVRLLDRDGNVLECVLTATARRSADGGISGYEGIIEDVTERREAEARLLHDAFHDRLTGLPNRALFMDRLAQLVKRGRRREVPSFTVLFLDLDRFKPVNDSLGHGVGDQLLVEIGQRLERCLRPGDTVARVGGDEFAVLLDGTGTAAEAESVATRIHLALEAPFGLAGREVYASVSIGIALGRDTYVRAEDVLRDADIAMYRSKETGRARSKVFDHSMHEEAVAKLELETNLRLAVERQEFALHFQPIVSLKSGRTAGFEALIRWQHPERGLLAPDEFIAMAEETGLIVPIGWWALEEAARRAREWWHAEREAPYVAVNLSATQLSQPDLIHQLRGVLARTGAPPASIRLELTENVIMEQAEATVRTLEKLRALGVSLMIDDFGTGYSSLSYLHRFAAQALKIDEAFTEGVGPNGEDSEIVRTIVALADELGMEVVAEGVETPAQLRIVRILGCTAAQGYYLARPADGETAAAGVEREWEIT